MNVYRKGQSIDTYYNVMGYSDIEDQIKAEVAKYVKLCEKAAKHNVDEEEYKGMARTVFYHILELRSTRKPSPLTWSDGNRSRRGNF